MKSKFCIFMIFILMLTLSSCSSIKDKPSLNNKTPSKKQWIEDIDFLKNTLAKKHINAYHTISKEDYAKKFIDLKSDVLKLEDYEIKLRIAQIVASIGDAHTSSQLNFDTGTGFYPFELSWLGKDLKVLAIDKSYSDIIGNSLIAINNMPIEDVIANVNTLISHENNQWIKLNNVQLIKSPEVLKFLEIATEDTAEFTFIDDKGNTKKLKLSPKASDIKDIIQVKDLMPKKPLCMKHEGNYFKKIYWYEYIPDDKIMYFQYNSCIDRNVAKRYGYKNYEQFPEFDKFSEQLVKELNNREIEKFIIDLRGNPGGDSRLFSNFVNELCNIEKLKHKGKIFVITGRNTFSSGLIACIELKYLTKALFFGEPTGENVNHYGEVRSISLPNSKIMVSYSTKYFELSSEYKENFIPDVLIEQSFNNYINGIDDVYEAIRSYKN